MNRSLSKRVSTSNKPPDVKCKIIDEKKKVPSISGMMRIDRTSKSVYEKRSSCPSTKSSSTSSTSSSCTSTSSFSSSSSASYTQKSVSSRIAVCKSIRSIYHPSNQSSNIRAQEKEKRRSNVSSRELKGKKYTPSDKSLQICTNKCNENVTIAKVSPLPITNEKDNSMKKVDERVGTLSIITSSDSSISPPSPPSPPPTASEAPIATTSSSPSTACNESNCNTVTSTTFTLDHCTTANKKVILLPQEVAGSEENTLSSFSLLSSSQEKSTDAREEKEPPQRGERKEECLYSTMSTNDEMYRRLLSREKDTLTSQSIQSIVTQFNDSEDKHLHSKCHLSSLNQVKLHCNTHCEDEIHLSLSGQDRKADDHSQVDSGYIVPPTLRLMIQSYQVKSSVSPCSTSYIACDSSHWTDSNDVKRLTFNSPSSVKYHPAPRIQWSYSGSSNASETVQEDEAGTREIKDLQSQVKCSKEKVSDLTSQLFANAQMMSAFEKTLSTLSMKLQQLTLVNHQKDMEISRLRAVTDVMIAYKEEQEKCNNKTCHNVKQTTGDTRDNVTDVNVINSLPSSPSKRLWIKSTLNKAFLKNKITQSPSKKVPCIDTNVTASPSSTLSHASSSSSSSCGWTEAKVDENTLNNHSIVNELREKLTKADGILEKTRLEAITSAFHLENTKELVNSLREEATYLRQVNSQLELNVKKKQSSMYQGANHKHQLLLC